MVDTSTDAVTKLLDGVTPGRAVQFHPRYCDEAKDSPFGDWDTSHHVSVIRDDGSRYRVAEFKHSSDAAFYQTASDLVPALLAERDALKAERDEAIEGWHVIHPNITVQDAALVERVACAMWKAEADRAAPNVGRNRTPEMFENELDGTRAKWIGLADAALRAITEGRE